MSKVWLKRGIWLALMLISLVGIFLILKGAGAIITYFQEGADPGSALNIVPNKPPDYQTKVVWLPDDPDTGRVMEPFTRDQIEAAYIRAWLQWNLSQEKGSAYGLKTYFTGPTLDAISNAIQQSVSNGFKITQTTTEHHPQLHFYSADGSIVSFTEEGARVEQIIRDKSGQVILADERNSRYDVVMLLEDGNWRIRHMVRINETNPADNKFVTVPKTGFVRVDGATLTLDGQPFQAAGVNYYPQATPWDKFWLSYKPTIIDEDLKRVKDLGLNTLRIFVPFTQFGGTTPTEAYLKLLDDFLKRADQQGLKVIVTLFDFRTDYNPLLWADADRHLETILTRFKDYASVLAWDLKNEPDLDYKTGGRETVDLWLRHVAITAREFDPNHLITIGWSTSSVAATASNLVDFVSFHYYTPAVNLPAEYNRLKTATADKAIMVTEFGLPTWNTFFPNGHSEPEQAEYYADIIKFLRASGSAGYMAWTLYDFSYIPGSVAGALPWQNGPQKELGILKADGKPKPAAALLAPGSSLDVTRVPSWAQFLKPFWLGSLVMLLLFIYLVWRFRLVERSIGMFKRFRMALFNVPSRFLRLFRRKRR